MKVTKRENIKTEALDEGLLSLNVRGVFNAFRGEHFSFIAISFYLIFEYLKLEQAYPIFGVLPLLRLSLIAAMLAYVVDQKSKLNRSLLGPLLVAFLLQCLLSALSAYRPSVAFERIDIILVWVLVYFLVTGIVSTERRLFLFLLVYFLVNLKMSQFGFFSWVQRGFAFADWGVTGAGWYRNSGELGMQMAMFFSYTVCFVAYFRSFWPRWKRMVMYFLPLSALACVIASSSRGAVISTSAALLYLSLFSKRGFKILVASIAIGVVVYMFMPPEFLARFSSAGDDATSVSRLTYWKDALEILRSHPIFGVGYYNWDAFYRDHYFDPSLHWRVEEAHNTFLQIGAELGYVGLGLFVLMVLSTFWINWRTMKLCAGRPGFEFLRCFAMGMNAAGVALVVGSNFLTAFVLPSYWMHFALTACLSSIVKKKLVELSRSDGKRPGRLRSIGDAVPRPLL